jgi:hypothetical protein
MYSCKHMHAKDQYALKVPVIANMMATGAKF